MIEVDRILTHRGAENLLQEVENKLMLPRSDQVHLDKFVRILTKKKKKIRSYLEVSQILLSDSHFRH